MAPGSAVNLGPGDVEKFWSRSTMALSGCRIWSGARITSGYGHFYLRGTHFYAHRFALLLTIGAPHDPAFVVRHSCDNPPCCNPEHLAYGSEKANMRDCIERGRFSHLAVRRGEQHGGAKLTAAQVVEIRKALDCGVVGTILAAKYGVSKNQISHIRLGKTWR